MVMQENLTHLLLFGISGPINLMLFLLSQPLIPELLAWAMCVFLYWFIFPLVTMFVSFYVYFHHFWKSCF